MIQLVAEAGSTHRGDVDAACECAYAAKSAGADSIKYILSDPDELIADKSIQYEGQLLYDVVKGYQMDDENWRKVADYCKQIEVPFFFTVGTPNYIRLAVELGSFALKIGGWCSRNFPLIDACLDTGFPLWFDFGAVIEPEIDGLWHYCRGRGAWALTFLHESHSPNSAEWNLRSIPFMKERWPAVTIGYSSPDCGVGGDFLAVALGAKVIEKRIKPQGGTGHHADKALDPGQFASWVQMMRTAESMLGKEGLYPSMADVASKQKFFTSLVFNRDATKGEIVTEDMLAARRPGNGLSPLYSYLWIGKRLARDVKRNEILTYDTCEETVDES